jgi:Na+-translocating ferredoxin:NAD+ oxidoreductase subunit G
MNASGIPSSETRASEARSAGSHMPADSTPDAMPPASPLGEMLRQSWLVMLLAMTLGGMLAGAERWLQPRIEQQAERRLVEATRLVVPGGSHGEEISLPSGVAYRVVDQQGEPVGWAVPATVTGFVDKIELLIGLSIDGSRVLGLAVLQSKETPGLGDRIRDEDFRAQFRDLPTGQPLDVVKPGQSSPHGIDAIAGATISTWAVARGVYEQVEKVRSELVNRSSGL